MSEVSIIFDTCLSFNSKSHLVSDPTEKEKLTSVTGFESVNILLLIILMVLILSCFMVTLIPPADSNTYCLMPKPKKECTWHMVLGRHFIWSWHPLLMFLNMTLKFSSVSESRNQYSLLAQYEICLQSWPILLYYHVEHSCLQIIPLCIYHTSLHQINLPEAPFLCHFTIPHECNHLYMLGCRNVWEVLFNELAWLLLHELCLRTHCC